MTMKERLGASLPLRLYSKSSLTLTLECDSNEMHSSRVEV
jgi:hypothetical protein